MTMFENDKNTEFPLCPMQLSTNFAVFCVGIENRLIFAL